MFKKIWDKIKWIVAVIVSVVGGLFLGYFVLAKQAAAENIETKAELARRKKEDELSKMSNSAVVDELDNAAAVRRIIRGGTDTPEGGGDIGATPVGSHRNGPRTPKDMFHAGRMGFLRARHKNADKRHSGGGSS